MSDKEKVIVKRENDADQVSALDLDVEKAITLLVEEFKGLEEHFDIKDDELGVTMVDNLRATAASILASFNARNNLIRKLVY